MSWKSALDDFLEHAAVTHPTAATKQHAIAYRSWLSGTPQSFNCQNASRFPELVFGQFCVSCDLIPLMSFKD